MRENGAQYTHAALWVAQDVPAAWPEFALDYRFGSSLYAIPVQNPGTFAGGSVRLRLDGRPLDQPFLTLVDDGATHEVLVTSPTPVSHCMSADPRQGQG